MLDLVFIFQLVLTHRVSLALCRVNPSPFFGLSDFLGCAASWSCLPPFIDSSSPPTSCLSTPSSAFPLIIFCFFQLCPSSSSSSVRCLSICNLYLCDYLPCTSTSLFISPVLPSLFLTHPCLVFVFFFYPPSLAALPPLTLPLHYQPRASCWRLTSSGRCSSDDMSLGFSSLFANRLILLFFSHAAVFNQLFFNAAKSTLPKHK